MRSGFFQVLVFGAVIVAACGLAHGQGVGEIAINCGGAALTAANGTSWSADSYFSGGDLVYVGDAISNTPDLGLYRSARAGLYGDFSYAIPVANGNYTLNLLFAELQYWNVGDRVFNVTVNGAPLLTNFDILTQTASRTALVKSFPISVATGSIQIAVQGVVRRGILNGIRIVPAGGTVTTPAPPAAGVSILNINAGGNAFTGADGAQWAADQSYSGGDLAYTSYPISGSPDLQLYRSGRRGLYGNFSYTIPLSNGAYNLKLRFAEILLGGKGQRVFNVNVNGAPVLTNFDIVADAGGALIADDKTFPVAVTNGNLQIDVIGVVGFGLLNGIQVYPSTASFTTTALSLSTTSLSFAGAANGSNPAAQTVGVANTGSGTLSWTAAANQPWLTVTPASGSGAGTLSVVPVLAGMAAGNYTAAVTVTAPGATGASRTVNITLSVAAAVQPPAASVSPNVLGFTATAGGASSTQAFSIANTGGGTLSWTASRTQSWLTLSAASGTGPATLSAQASAAGLAAGTYHDIITINPGAAIAVTLTVAAAVQPPALSLTPSTLAFSATASGGNPAPQSIAIVNGGGGALSWTASKTQPWLSLSASSGSDAGTIFVSANVAGLAAGVYTDTLTINAPGATPSLQTAAVTFTVAPAAPATTQAPLVSINCGGDAMSGTDGVAWTGDRYYSGGDLAYTGYTIGGSPDLSLFRSARRGLYGDFSYTIPVPNGSYLLKLRFAEIIFSDKGQRVFNVNVNGAPLLTDFDIIADAGSTLTVDDRQFPVTVSNGKLQIDFVGVMGRGLVNGIQVFPTTSATTAPPVPPSLPAITSFTATGTTLSWATTGATAVTIDNGIGAVAATSSTTVNPAATTTYTLTATNTSGSVTRTATVTVAASVPTITSFTATGTTLSWATTGATTVTIDNGIGAVGATSSTTVNPAATTTYSLTATNVAGSVTRTLTVTVTTAAQPPSGTSFKTDQWTAVPYSPQIPTGGETLYNGIQLPTQWPPLKSPTQASTVPSYILHPPAVIPINTGRQLFVDDYLIGATNLTRVAHQPTMYAGNPVLAPGTQGLDNSNSAFPFSDGVWFDPADHLFKLWYFGGYGNDICYAYSTDGKNWIKPRIADAVVPNTNIVLQIGGGRDSTTVVMDLHDPNPARKFKAFVYYTPSITPILWIFFSPDGIHWTGPQSNTPLSLSDRTTVFFNPFRKVWVESARQKADLPATPTRAEYFARARYYSESSDLQTWNSPNPQNTYWTGPEDRDPAYPGSTRPPDLYTLDGVAYESLIVGMFSWYYPSDGPELVELGIGFSRDGFNWVRPTRSNGPDGAFIPSTNLPNTWNGYNTQSAGGGFLVVGDQLYFYFSGRDAQHNVETSATRRQTGLATLRRDGFYSMDAGAAQGVLTTRPVEFNGSHLFVNVVDPAGQLQVEVLDADGNVIPQFSKANSAIVSADKTVQEVTWNAASLSSLAGRTVQFRFYLTNGSLYSFWVTSSAAGASYGYVAAGGPGFTGDTDTVGSATGGLTATGASAAPVLSPAGGTFSGSVTVTMSSTTAGAAIRYTSDGSDPSAGSTLYSGPLTLHAGVTVKAKAFGIGIGDSGVTLGLFTVQEDATPPNRGSGAPAGTLSSGTTQATLSLRTSESAVCRYATAANTLFTAMAGAFSTADGIAHTAAVSGLTNGGLYTYYVRCQDANGNANADDYVITFAVAGPGAFVPFYDNLEAESGALMPPMAIASDGLASGGKYIATPVDSGGSVTYTIDVPVTGTYYVWCRIQSVDAGSDSFYVSADGGPTDVFDTAENKWSGSWQWTVVNGRGSTGHALALNPRAFTLSAGTHTLTFAGRDPSTKLDRLVVTNDAAFVPYQ